MMLYLIKKITSFLKLRIMFKGATRYIFKMGGDDLAKIAITHDSYSDLKRFANLKDEFMVKRYGNAYSELDLRK